MRGQPVGAAVDERHAPAPLEAAEAGRLAGHPQVAPGRQLEPAGDAPALDGGDHRLRELQPGRARAGRRAAGRGRSLRLAPAQNAVVSPVSTATRASGSASKARNSSCRRAAVALFTALRTCGWSMRTHDRVSARALSIERRHVRCRRCASSPVSCGGRRLAAPPGAATRPTSDRVREATFNALEQPRRRRGRRPCSTCSPARVPSASRRCRGAPATATFVERDRAALDGPPGQPRRASALGRRPGRRSSAATSRLPPDAAAVGPRPPRPALRLRRLGRPARRPRRRRRGVRVGRRRRPAGGWEVARAKAYGGTVVTILRRNASRRIDQGRPGDHRALPRVVRPVPQRPPRARRDRVVPVRRRRRRPPSATRRRASGSSTLEEREEMIEESLAHLDNIKVVQLLQARRRRGQGGRRRLHRQGPAGRLRLRERDDPGPDEPRVSGVHTLFIPSASASSFLASKSSARSPASAATSAPWSPSRWPSACKEKFAKRADEPTTSDDDVAEPTPDDAPAAPDPVRRGGTQPDAEQLLRRVLDTRRRRPADAAVVVGDDQPRRGRRAARGGDRPPARRAAGRPLAAQGARGVPGQGAPRGRRHPRPGPGPGRADGAAHRGGQGRRGPRPPDRRAGRGPGPPHAPRVRGLLRPEAGAASRSCSSAPRSSSPPAGRSSRATRSPASSRPCVPTTVAGDDADERDRRRRATGRSSTRTADGGRAGRPIAVRRRRHRAAAHARRPAPGPRSPAPLAGLGTSADARVPEGADVARRRSCSRSMTDGRLTATGTVPAPWEGECRRCLAARRRRRSRSRSRRCSSPTRPTSRDLPARRRPPRPRADGPRRACSSPCRSRRCAADDCAGPDPDAAIPVRSPTTTPRRAAEVDPRWARRSASCELRLVAGRARRTFDRLPGSEGSRRWPSPRRRPRSEEPQPPGLAPGRCGRPGRSRVPALRRRPRCPTSSAAPAAGTTAARPSTSTSATAADAPGRGRRHGRRPGPRRRSSPAPGGRPPSSASRSCSSATPSALGDAGGLEVLAGVRGHRRWTTTPASACARRRTPRSNVAAEAVRDGAASAMVSAGNTGATMGSAPAAHGPDQGRRPPGDRHADPAAVGAAPTCCSTPAPTPSARPAGWCSSPRWARSSPAHRFGIDGPAVALLSIGEEKSKGNELVKETHALLAADGAALAAGAAFIGNVEGRDLHDRRRRRRRLRRLHRQRRPQDPRGRR